MHRFLPARCASEGKDPTASMVGKLPMVCLKIRYIILSMQRRCRLSETKEGFIMTQKILQPALVRAFRDSSEAVTSDKAGRYSPAWVAKLATREAAWAALAGPKGDRAGMLACRTQRMFQRWIA